MARKGKKHSSSSKLRKRDKSDTYSEVSQHIDRFFQEYCYFSELVCKSAESVLDPDSYLHVKNIHAELATKNPKNVLDFFVLNMEDYYIAIADNMYDVVFAEGMAGPLYGPMRLKDVFNASTEETKLAIWKQLNKIIFYAYAAKYARKERLENELARFFIGNSFQKKFTKRSDKFNKSILSIEERIEGIFPIIEGTMTVYFTSQIPSDWSNAAPQFSRKILYVLADTVSEFIKGSKVMKNWLDSIEEMFDLLILEDHDASAAETDVLAKRIINSLPYEIRSPLKRSIRKIRAIATNDSVSWTPELAQKLNELIGDMSAFDALDGFIVNWTVEALVPVVSGLCGILVSKNIFAEKPDQDYINDISKLLFDIIENVFDENGIPEDTESPEDSAEDEISIKKTLREVVSRSEGFLDPEIRDKYMNNVHKYLDSDEETEEKAPESSEDLLAGITETLKEHLPESSPDDTRFDGISRVLDSVQTADKEDTSKIIDDTAQTVKEQFPEFYEKGKELFNRLFLKLVSSRKIYKIVIDATKADSGPSLEERSEISDMSIDTLKDIQHLDLPVWETVSKTVSEYEARTSK